MSKNQHTIPYFYLNRFIHPGWVYLCGSRCPKKVQSARSASVKEWFYSQNTGEQNYTLDSFNTYIETKTAPVLRELLNNRLALSEDSKLVFSYFIANLALRVPAHIKETGEMVIGALEQADYMAGKIMQEVHKIEVEENEPFIEVVNGESGSYRYTKKEWDNFLESLRQQDKVGKAMMETTMSVITDLAPIIANMGWVIIDASDGAFFITSDSPVYLTNIGGSRIGAGWENANAVGSLPLSPRRYLGLHYGLPSDTLGYKRVSAEEVEVLNARTIASASEAIFSPKKYPPAEDWMLKK